VAINKEWSLSESLTGAIVLLSHAAHVHRARYLALSPSTTVTRYTTHYIVCLTARQKQQLSLLISIILSFFFLESFASGRFLDTILKLWSPVRN